jgi:hypothetical protein
MSIDSNHPKQEFSCTVLAPADATLEARLRALASRLESGRHWTIGPPEFARFGDEDAEEASFGVILDVYSALPPWGERLPVAVDEAQLEEVRELVDALTELSRDLGQEVECHLGETYVGSIEDGEPDELIRDGLLGEWARQLHSRRGAGRNE